MPTFNKRYAQNPFYLGGKSRADVQVQSPSNALFNGFEDSTNRKFWPLVSIYPVFPPLLQDQSYYFIADSILVVKTEALFNAHLETFSGHCVYDFTGILGLSYVTKVGGCSPTVIPITWLQVTSSTMRLISSYSKSRARMRLSSNRIVLSVCFNQRLHLH